MNVSELPNPVLVALAEELRLRMRQAKTLHLMQARGQTYHVERYEEWHGWFHQAWADVEEEADAEFLQLVKRFSVR